MERLLRKELENARLEFGAIKTYSTPRRLAVAVSDLVERQPDLQTQAMGPAKAVAFDAEGIRPRLVPVLHAVRGLRSLR